MFGLQDELLAAWRDRRSTRAADPPMIIVLAAALVVLAGLFSAADAALTSFSRARAEELQAEGQAGRAAGWSRCSPTPRRT